MIQKLKQPFKTDPYDRPNDKFQKIQITIEDQDNFDAENQVQTSNLRFSRRKLTFAITAFVLGAVAILIESPARNEFLAPGPLSSQHAQLLAGQGAERCAACHDSGNQNLSQWLTRAFNKNNNAAECQSDLCMKCHEKTINVEFATKPHNLAPVDLQKKTDNFQLASFSQGFSPPIDKKGDIECGTCHKEHHGDVDLKMLTDRQCQTCHSQKYYSFENDHPDFSSWPQQRRQRIAFDHVSHFYKHFPGKEQTFDCKACHVDDQFQSVKLLAGYQQTCAQCHDKDIEGTSTSGVHLVSMPMLDLEAIKDQSLELGEWPIEATGDFDGRIPELMRLLLFKDQNARRILESRGQDFEFCDFDPENAEDIRDAVELAWATKNLLYDLATKGKVEIRKRLEFALQRTISEVEYLALTDGVDANVFASAANRWLPNLANEVPAFRSNQTDLAAMYRSQKLLYFFKDEDPGLLAENPLQNLIAPPMIQIVGDRVESSRLEQGVSDGAQNVELSVSQKQNNSAAKETVQGNWLTGEAESIQAPALHSEKEQAHIAQNDIAQKDPVSTGRREIPVEELLAQNPIADLGFPERQGRGPGKIPPTIQNNDLGKAPLSSERRNQSQIFDTTPLPIKPVKPIQPMKSIPESELLAINPLSASQVEDSDTSFAPSSKTQEVQTAEAPIESIRQQVVEKDSEIAEEFIEQVAQAKNSEKPKSGSFEIEEHGNVHEKYVGTVGKTGWFRNDQLFQISYRVSGHADRFMTAMMDVVSETSNVSQNPATAPFFLKMTSKAAVGACFQCHTIDRKKNSTHEINWETRYRNPLYRDFTKFSHRPHLTQPQLRNCTACHALNEESSNAHTFVHFDSSEVLSNFSHITKSNCTSCHFKGSTNSGCTQCHNYHVGSRVSIGK